MPLSSSAINPSRQVLSDEVLQPLADVACVPPEQRDFFFNSVCRRMDFIWELDEFKNGLAKRRSKNFYSTALPLYDTLGNLNDRERALIERIFSSNVGSFLTEFQRAE